MSLTAWAPQNSNPAWGVRIPQKMLETDGMTQIYYEGLLTKKLAKLIEWMDPAEQADLDSLLMADLATPQEQAAHLMARVETPYLMAPITAAPRDRDLETYLEEEQLTDFLMALRDKL